MRMIIRKSLVGALFVLTPVAASAMDDATYCQALIKKYHTFMPAHRSEMAGTVDVNVAIEQCRTGNAAAGIPVLEKKLSDARLDLPSRDEPPAKP